jgi:aldehyde:ferredoxin oxidoreductase
MYNGYFGKVLRIDVSSKTFSEELIDSKLYRILMGGSCPGRSAMARYAQRFGFPK